MKHEVAYGIIPLKEENGTRKIFLALHTKGPYWGFPKGHPDEGESPKETATRELFEETQLKVVSFLGCGPYKENHRFERNGMKVSKAVTYYPAHVSGDFACQTEEVTEGRWCTLEDALSLVKFEKTRALIQTIFEQCRP